MLGEKVGGNFLVGNQIFVSLRSIVGRSGDRWTSDTMRFLLTTVFFFLSIAVAFGSDVNLTEIARLRESADSLHSIGRTDSAAVVGQQAIDLAVKSGDRTQIVGTHAAQGVFLRSLGRIDDALKHYEAALEIVTSEEFRTHPDQEAIEETASLYINLAVLNLDTQNKGLAAANAELAGEWAAKSSDPALRSMIYGVAGSVQTGCGAADKALGYQELAYKDALEAGDKESAFRAAAYTMLIADRLGDKKTAAEWRETCNGLLPEIESTMARLVYYQAECSICLANGDTKDSLGWFNKILSLDGIDKLPFVKFDCYNNMHRAYASLGDYENAYSTLMLSNELRDSLWAQEKEESLRALTVKYQTKETELALAQSEARGARTLMWLFAVAGALLIAVIIFIIYADRQRRRRMQKEIEFANLRQEIGRQLTEQYIEGLEYERQRMSRELHDGVCNDLLGIGMNIRNGCPLEETAVLIENCRESVRRISHELMPPEFEYADIDTVLRYFVAKQNRHSSKVRVTYDAESVMGGDWSEVPDAIALEVYRIVQEATGNSLKHSGASEISVRVIRDDNNLEVMVCDNGTCAPGTKKGLGMDSIRKRARSIGGDISVEHPDGRGTVVRLSVKFSAAGAITDKTTEIRN